MSPHTSISSRKLKRRFGTTGAPALIDVRIDDDFVAAPRPVPTQLRSHAGVLIEQVRRHLEVLKSNALKPCRATEQERRMVMWIRNISCTMFCLALLLAGPARALTHEELVAKLEAAGYTKVSDIKSTAEGTFAKAIKDGKEVRLVVDSKGQVKEQP